VDKYDFSLRNRPGRIGDFYHTTWPGLVLCLRTFASISNGGIMEKKEKIIGDRHAVLSR